VLLAGTVYFASTNRAAERAVAVRPAAEVVEEACEEYLALDDHRYVDAALLHANLTDADPRNDPFVVSVQAEGDFLRGHIPGALNIPWETAFRGYSLEKLPADRPLVVYCEDGHNSSRIASLLNVMGYDAYVLRWGLCSWTRDLEVLPGYPGPWADRHDYPLETAGGANGTVRTGAVRAQRGICGVDDEPAPESEDPAVREREALRKRVDSYLHSDVPPGITADELYGRIMGDDGSEDAGDAGPGRPFVLSLQGNAAFSSGHIPGSERMSFRHLLDVDSLGRLPDDGRAIVVVSATGQLAAQAAAILSINGYDAMPLKGGMSAWTRENGPAQPIFDPDLHSHAFPMEKA